MSDIRIDLQSDTQTRPTPGMMRAMAEAPLGDEQVDGDPTTDRLCAMVAGLFGKEAAVLMPSGTMCNLAAILVHCRPGDEILCDRTAHIITSESGGPAAIAGAMPRALDGVNGIFTPDQVVDGIRDVKRNAPRTRLLHVEQTANLGGGTVWPLAALEAVTETARRHGLATHMDGARLMNATVASGVAAGDYGRLVDSLWLDLSKGLGCPVGGVLAGSAAFIEEAWCWKQRLGGAMRQSGVLAAAGIYALDNHVERLAEDHANARAFAEGVRGLPGVVPDPGEVPTNIVFLDVTGTGMTTDAFRDRVLEHGVRLGRSDRRRLRAVTHLDVTRAHIDEAVRAVRDVAGAAERVA